MIKNINFLIFLISFPLLLQNVCVDGMGIREQEKMLQNCKNVDGNTIIEVVRDDLLSNNVLLQDAGCIILLKIFHLLKNGDGKAEFIFSQLSVKKNVVYSTAEIIDSRLPGWYAEEKSEEKDDGAKIYTPLFYILGKTNYKTARGTLVRSLLYLHDRKDILGGIPVSNELVTLSLNRLKLIEKKQCCVYPGRDLVITKMENNARSGMLHLFEGILLKDKVVGEKKKHEIKQFIIDCMEYGDSKKGYLIRTKAVKLAWILVMRGETNLIRKIEDISKNDPYYIHEYNDRTGYSMTELKYPVREICSNILKY
jgi:hypothetical protein